jgi:hypothetical protein
MASTLSVAANRAPTKIATHARQIASDAAVAAGGAEAAAALIRFVESALALEAAAVADGNVNAFLAAITACAPG